MLKKRLLWHLYPPFLIILIVSIAAVAWYSCQSLSKFYHSHVSKDLVSRIYLVQDQILKYLNQPDFRQIDNFCKQTGPASSTRITVILPDGQVVGDSDEKLSNMRNHSDRPEFQQAMEKGFSSMSRTSGTLGKKMMYAAMAIKQDDRILAVIRTSVPITAIDETLVNIYKQLIWAGLIVSVCAAFFSLAISKKITRPIEQMTEIAKHFASGQLDIRVPLADAVELADLSQALNEMARQLNAKITTISDERSHIEAILSSMIEGVLAVDSAGHVVNINKAAAKLLQIDQAAAVGLNIEEVVRNSQLQQYIKNMLENKQFFQADGLIANDGGRYLQLYGSNLIDNKGNSSGAVLVLNDITRTRRLEDVRRDFVANVSHELKTPVTSIKGFVETLLDGAINDSQQAMRFLEIIVKHADRLNAIIDDLLSLSRLEEDSEKRRLAFEVTSLKQPLVTAIEFLKLKANEKNIEIELSCDEKIVGKINPVLIEQAVINLVNNAIKYSQENSSIQVSAEQTENHVIIKVSDRGCGIAKEHLERIFERFYVVDKSRSRKLGGTGLGLSIVKHIAQVHGGYVTVESKVNAGSTFTIHLPLNVEDSQNV